VTTPPKISKGYYPPSLRDAVMARVQMLEMALERGDINKARAYCRSVKATLPAAFEEGRA